MISKKSQADQRIEDGSENETETVFSIFLGGLPPNSKRAQITDSVNRALLKIGVEGEWDLELKGKKGKNGHLGFGFIHFKNQNHQQKALRIFSEAYKLSKSKKFKSKEPEEEGEALVAIYVLGKIIEVKKAWSVEEHKSITDKDRKRKVYISCLRKSVRRGKIVAPRIRTKFQFRGDVNL